MNGAANGTVTSAARRSSATIVAFDGLVADTLSARALAVSESVSAEIARCSVVEALSLVRGRSLDEAIERALRTGCGSPDREVDATVRDLAVLRARRSFTAMVSQGLPLRDEAAAWLAARAATHGRIVLRAESARRDVDRLIQFTGLADVVAFIRCSDDLPRAVGASSTENSWSAIASRLAAQRVPLDECTAFECSDLSANVARGYLNDVLVVAALA